MAETIIHNGEVIVDGRPVREAEPAEPGKAPGELQPDEIAEALARCISEGQAAKLLPMELVNRLLTLQVRGQKVLWTKWDVRQLFALWSKKMEGSLKA